MWCAEPLLFSLWLMVCGAAGVTSEPLSRHKRAWIIDSFKIEEGNPGPFPYELGTVQIERKYRVFFELTGQGVEEEPRGVLSIQRETGTILVHKPLDYEEHQLLRLTFESRKEDLELDTKLGVEVQILDINDNPPRFQRDVYEITIGEAHVQGSYLVTVVAHDRDKTGSPNSTFHYAIASVSPNPPNAQFFIDDHGTVIFKGCLEHEVGEKYTVVVEAKDHGEVVSLSSSTTIIINVQDDNNHLPIITGQTGSGKVLEGETGASPLRLHVTDRDTKGTPAWRAKYSIEGDEGEYFKIETDPESNDGILTVVKPLDFEDGAERQLTVSVENEQPYFSCEVKERTSSGLWTVDTTGGHGSSGGPLQRSSERLTVHVEDANDPPVFTVPARDATLEENSQVGSPVTTMTAVDPDSSHASEFVYVMGDDPDGWVEVDAHTGLVTTAKTLDRESPYMVNDVYTVILYAVDNGDPAMTGTGTLRIHLLDQNDNRPQLVVNHVEMCVSDGPTSANITAFDLDQDPYGGPFLFQLLGDVDGKWSLDPLYGFSVNLVREPSVHAGLHTVDMKVSDKQGQSATYGLSVTVCDCSVSPGCQRGRASASRVGYGAAGIILTSLLVLLVFLLLAVFMSCGKEMSVLQVDSLAVDLLPCNTETPGSDCQIPILPRVPLPTDNHQHTCTDGFPVPGGAQQTQLIKTNFFYDAKGYRVHHVCHLLNGNSLYKRTAFQSLIDNGYYNQQEAVVGRCFWCKQQSSDYVTHEALLSLFQQRLQSIQAQGEELGDYDPHLYAEEGDSEAEFGLEPIFIPDDTLDLKELENLNPKFLQLAALCSPTSNKP